MGRTNDPLYASVHEFDATQDKDGPKFTMAFIEFTEQGGLASPRQFSDAAQRLEACQTNSTPILLFYLHGWRNNSRSEDVVGFCTFAEHLARCLNSRRPQGGVNPYHLFCVYLAWGGSYFSEDRHPNYSEYSGGKGRAPRGTVNNLSIHDTQIGTLFDYGTFWSRKAAAENVASLELTEVLTALADSAHRKPEGRAIALAHSFGALILERTLAQALPAMVHEGKLTLPFDLTVLMNPAAEGLTAYRIIDFVKRRVANCEAEAECPAIVTITAMNDMATRYWFTAGTIPKRLGLWLPWNRFLNSPVFPWVTQPDGRSVRSTELLTCTSGHSRYLPSHDLRFREGLPRGEPRRPGAMGFDARGGGTNAWIFAVNLGTHPDPDLYRPKDKEVVLWQNPRDGNDRVASVWECVELGPKRETGNVRTIFNHTPYWVLRVPPEVVSGHSGIWSDNATSLLTALYRMSGRIGEPSRRDFEILSVSAMHEKDSPTGGLIDVGDFQTTTGGGPIPEPTRVDSSRPGSSHRVPRDISTRTERSVTIARNRETR